MKWLEKTAPMALTGASAGGFGGLNAAKELADKGIGVTLIDKTTHHLFSPLRYQWQPPVVCAFWQTLREANLAICPFDLCGSSKRSKASRIIIDGGKAKYIAPGFLKLSQGLVSSLLAARWPITVTALVSTTVPCRFSNFTVAVPVSSCAKGRDAHPDKSQAYVGATVRCCLLG
jgi:hypothetical protein